MSIVTHQRLWALTVRQPWAWALVEGHKRVENRSWAPGPGTLKPGDRFVIHAGMKDFTDADAAQVRSSVARSRGRDVELGIGGVSLPAKLPRGALVGLVTFVGVVASRAQLEPGQTVWWVGPKAWLVSNPRPLQPISASGAQGLWEVPGELAFQVWEQLGESRKAER